MILVTLGTQDKQFYRLLKAIDECLSAGIITDKVIVQAGYSSDYQSDKMEIFDLIPMDDFNKLIKECDLLITHGGVGSIISGLQNNKKVIAAARLKKYNEHTNDHQLQIINNFEKSGFLIKLEKMEQLGEILTNIDSFQPNNFKSNNANFVKLIKEEIDKFL